MTTPKLRDYQLSVLEKAREHYAAGKKWGIIQAATGAGKTYIQAEQTRRAVAKGLPVVLVAPLRRLVDQLSETLAIFGVEHGVVMDGYPRTPALAQVCSRDTLYAMMRNEQPLPPARLVIPDECHVENGPILAAYREAYGTGYTATPCKGDGSGLGAPWEFIECAVPTAQLIAQKRLLPVKCYNPEEVGKGRLKGKGRRVAGDPVKHWRMFADGLRTVVFAANRDAAQDVMDKYLKAGVPAEYLDGESPDRERDAVLGTKERKGRLETGETLVVATVGIMLMGVDVPCLQCAQFLRGCGSFVLWRQGMGRPMRPFGGQEFCVILDHAGAAFEFGLPDLEVQWDVNPEVDMSVSARKKAREERVVCCPQCQRLFSQSPQCPGCDWKIPKPKKSAFKALSEQADAVLTEFQGQPQGVMMARAAWQKLWDRCLHATARRGGMVKQAAGMFSGQTKRPVWECGVNPMPERHEFGLPVAQAFPHIVGVRA